MKAEFDASNFLNKIKTISKRLEEVSGENTIPFNLLFNGEFLKEYSRFSSIDELFDASGFEINNQEDFDNLNLEKWDEFISQNTKFDNWKDMFNKAASVYFTNYIFCD